jgi:ComF family protein
MFSDFLSLFFPRICRACGNSLFKGEEVICSLCEYHLPKTGYHLFSDNPVAKNFWGKVPLHAATAMYFFNKGQKVQQLMHQLKYKNQREIGKRLGKLMGLEIKQSPEFADVDFILPVPLHQTRIRKRGYNQSDMIAEGMSTILQKPFLTDFLLRKKATETQTRKSRYERFENTEEIFDVNPQNKINAKHFLLVDDVVTTGSTLVSCASVLIKKYPAKVSIAALACAQ